MFIPGQAGQGQTDLAAAGLDKVGCAVIGSFYDDRAARLVAYQNTAYAERYTRLVGEVRERDTDQEKRLTKAVARGPRFGETPAVEQAGHAHPLTRCERPDLHRGQPLPDRPHLGLGLLQRPLVLPLGPELDQHLEVVDGLAISPAPPA